MAVAHSFHIGVDLGQRQDYTAVVGVEQQILTAGKRDPVTYEPVCWRKLVVRLIERVRLGTAYGEVATELERLTGQEELRGGLVTLSVDATGLGSVVTEDIRRKKIRGELIAVTLHGGQTERYADGYYNVPRMELLQNVVRAFEQGELVLAGGCRGRDSLLDELRGMRKVVKERGVRYETAGRHDDLVFALGLALVGARRRVLPVSGSAVRRRLGLVGWERR